MRQLVDFIKAHIGEAGFIILIGLVLSGAGLAFLIFTISNRPGLINTLMIALILIVGLALAWQIRIPAERIHILEYGVVGWFAGRDLIRKEKIIKGAILACIFSTMIGVIDEAFQAILPYRFCNLLDIGANSLGGAWGVILYLLGAAPLRRNRITKAV